MADRTQQHLLGYLVGALEESERARLEERLADSPELRAELARAEDLLHPLRAAPPAHRAPEGLAARTCRMVFAYSEALAGRLAEARARCAPSRQRARAMSPAAVPPSSTTTWGWSDLVVAVGVFLAVASLIFPAIQHSRMNTRLVGCQNNLRDLGLSQAQFQQAHPDLRVAGGPDGRWMPSGVPSGLPLRRGVQGVSSSPIPGWPAPLSCQPWRMMPVIPASGGRALWSPHHGISQAVCGANVLLPDGHVIFHVVGPAWAPPPDESQPEGSVVPVWPVGGSDGAAPTPFTSIVPGRRPGL